MPQRDLHYIITSILKPLIQVRSAKNNPSIASKNVVKINYEVTCANYYNTKPKERTWWTLLTPPIQQRWKELQHISRNGVCRTLNYVGTALNQRNIAYMSYDSAVSVSRDLFCSENSHSFQCSHFRAEQATLKVNQVMVNSLEDTLGKT